MFLQVLSDATVTLALVAEAVRLPAVSKLRLVKRDRLGQGQPQGVQIRLLGEGQSVPHVGVDLHRLGEETRPPALGLDPSVA